MRARPRPGLAVGLAALMILAARAPAQAGPHDPYQPTPPLGIHPPEGWIPADNPVTPAKVALGRDLFFDDRLSRDFSVSCASCHKPRFGWADPRAQSVGVDGQSGTRNAPSVVNRALARLQFLDGRADGLEAQALGPIANPVEMDLDPAEACHRLNQDPATRERFQQVFGGPATPDRLAKALATFERTLLSGNAPVDRWRQGDDEAMGPAAQRGFSVFMGSGCHRCHRPGMWTDEDFHNLGVGMDAAAPDLGRFAVTGADRDRGAFRTPNLRNVSETAPYMHDGSLETLEEVLELYVQGGRANPYLSPALSPLRLSDAEKADLLTFLREGLRGDLPTPAASPP